MQTATIAFRMSPRASALVGMLRHELLRVGRPRVVITLGTDERTVMLADTDGRWQGPLPAAYGALAAYEDGEGRTAQFWQRFAAARSSG